MAMSWCFERWAFALAPAQSSVRRMWLVNWNADKKPYKDITMNKDTAIDILRLPHVDGLS